MQNMFIAAESPRTSGFDGSTADRPMSSLSSLILLLCSFGPMTTAIIRWTAASDLRARARRADSNGDLKLAKELTAEAETAAHQRRNRVSLYLVGWVAGFVPATMLWQHQTGGSYSTQVTVLAVSAVVGGWVISLKKTGPAVDMIIAAILLLVNVGTAWVTSPEAATTYAAVSAFCWVAAGVVWRLLNPEQGPPTAAGVPAHVRGGPSGGVSDTALMAAFAAAIPGIRSQMAQAKKLADKSGMEPAPVFSPFTVALSEDGSTSATVELPSPAVAADLNEKGAVDRFSGSLRLPPAQVVTREGNHPGQVDVRVLPKPVHAMALPEWPHWKNPILDPKRFCIGFNETAQPVVLGWANAESYAVLGMKGSGKTNTLRALILGLAAQNPNIRFHVFNGKGTGDFNPLEPILCTHVSGDDEQAADALLQFLKWMVKEASRRAKLLKDLHEQFPEQKFLPEHLGPKWGVYAERVIIDEVDTLIRLRPEIGKLITMLGEKYRAAQFGMIISTQSMVGKSDTGIRKAAASCDATICHYVQDHVETKAALGDGWEGPKPQTFRYTKTGDMALDGNPIKGLAAVKGASSDLARFPDLPLDHSPFKQMIQTLREEREVNGVPMEPVIGDGSGGSIDVERTVVHAALEVWPKNEHGEPYSSVHRSWIATAVSATDAEWRGKSMRAVTQALLAGIGDADKGHQCPPHGEPDGQRSRGFRHDSLLAVAFDLND